MDIISETEAYYSLNSVRTYCLTFREGNKEITEYIHCVVIEHLKQYSDNLPLEIKVKQIHNLKEYYSNKEYTNFTERMLKTSQLSIVNNVKYIN